MKIIGISLALVIVVVALVYGGIELFGSSGSEVAAPGLKEYQTLQNELAGARLEIKLLTERFDELEKEKKIANSPINEGTSVSVPAVAKEAEDSFYPKSTEDLRNYVFSVIDEERELRKEESQKRREDRQNKIAEFKKGPYEGLNLKINSMASVLNLDGIQKDRYFELHTTYQEKAKQLREGLDWRDRESRQNVMKEYGKIQEEFSKEVEGVLTADQVEDYNKMSSWSRSMFNTGYVSPPGQEAGADRPGIQNLFERFRRGRNR